MLQRVARYVAGRSALRNLTYPVADAVLRLIGRLRAESYDITNTIVVASSARGGSTWLAELVAAQPGAVILWEPLHPGNNPDCRRHGFGWQNCFPNDAEWQEQRRYLEKVLTGRDLSTRTLTSLELNISALISPTEITYIGKFVNANMILPEIVNEFSVPAIHMIRHPCAVVSSRLEHDAWNLEKSDFTLPENLFEKYPHIEKVFEKVETHEELLAFGWGTQNYVPIQYEEPLPWYLATYEDMVVRGQREIQKMSETFGLSVSGAVQRLETPSATASEEFKTEQEDRLTKWKDRLSRNQIDQILQVVHEIGVECYTESPMPDHSRLPAHLGTTE